ncbi:MAG: cupin domain-containing protein [Sandaracinus sp.]|nr:cupin domain-containing protein [Sandaracinus sp.]MCB9612267.1 cupin domain-containing protein [Sandaracinus sp.]
MKVVLKDKLATFDEPWSPRIVADYNGNDVMVAKFRGEFRRHSHPDTDDFFLVLEGEVQLEVGGVEHVLGPGELFVVPAGVEHRPRSERGASVLLIEPAGTPNTGDVATAVHKPRI